MFLAVDWPSILSFSLVGFLLVATMLVLLVFVMKALGAAFITHKKATPVEKHELREEEIAAIATALKLYKSSRHDKESEIITILKIKRAYSPWNSKIHGLTQMPDYRK